ncbi:MAG: AI-2E family transporter [Spirochaetes bacterium]|nr:AI-2E family transporter [Spirochaetota bacterium]
MAEGLRERRNSQAVHRVTTRRLTRRIVVTITVSLTAVIIISLVWALRPIVLPFLVGMLAAYLCLPLMNLFTRWGIPRSAGILILFGAFFVAITLIVNQIGSLVPDERDRLILRTRFQYKLNERYRDFMGLDESEGKGTMIYRYLGGDLDRLMESVNALLRLDAIEKELFMKYRAGYARRPVVSDRYYAYFLSNMREAPPPEQTTRKKGEPGAGMGRDAPTRLTSLMEAVKIWIIMPLVFLFLLIDDGEIKRFFIGMVPNRYFEVSLAVVDKVNRAIGNYLRGILTACSLVGVTYAILFTLIGFELKMAILIGFLAGAANAIPLVGPGIALVSGSAYALIAENPSSILPFINGNNMILAVAACVALVMALDNGVFQPFVVGGAVKLHPLAVFIGIIGGSMLFGVAGLILAIPTIVVVKETAFTLFRELNDYFII